MSDEKPQRPKRPQKRKEAGGKPRAENAVQKTESKKPKAASGHKSSGAHQTGKPVQTVIEHGPDTSRDERPKSEIEIPQSEIPMEVHHHPQLEHKPKPVKEYLLEGLMIFIAVMMGFIAENVREYIDDNEQVAHLTVQLVQDLKADTAQLGHNYREEDAIMRYNDTLVNLLQHPLGEADLPRIQKMAANSHSMWLFHPSGGALEAIKNQVHLRQFSNSDIISYFARYEKHIELLRTDEDINLQYERAYLDPFLTGHLTPANMVAAFYGPRAPSAQMHNLTQAALDQLATDMVLMRISSHQLRDDNLMIKNDAIDLLKYVQKHFDVGDK